MRDYQAPNWGKAPQSGWILAIAEDDTVLFDAYKRKGEALEFAHKEQLDGKLLRRCHCFDESTEYRYLCIGDRMQVIETICDAQQEKDMDPDLLYEDDQVLDPRFAPDDGVWFLRVINRYRYTDANTLTVDDYRLGGIYKDRQEDCL